MTKEKQRKEVSSKLWTGILTVVLAITLLCSPIFTQTVRAEDQVKIELTYVYVDDAGNNSIYVDTQYVSAGTTWGEFFGSYEQCYNNGAITNADANNEWKVSVQNVSYSSVDSYYSNEIKNFNSYMDCALVTYYGFPSSYKQAFYSFTCYRDNQCIDSGTGWDLLMPSAYAYGSDEAVAYAKNNIGMYSYIANLCNAPGATYVVEANNPGNEGGKWDGYNVKITVPSNFSFSVSGNVADRNSESDAEVKSTDSSDGNVEIKPTDVVKTSDGKSLTSTVGGIYVAKTVDGVAVTTAKEEVANAAGLSKEEVQSGTNVRFYVCDSYNKGAKDALKAAADQLDKKVVGYINVDLYSINKKGVVTSIRKTNDPIDLVLGVPSSLEKADGKFSVICLVDGKPVVMEDTDSDAKTITIHTNNFGVYAIVY